ncbi:hypothetical protein HMN09_01129600 [Mycena chlorophos]|uniref:DUF7730 domain-containing protein n=1 Tax=Mycena chlorophos TaxID=658473 RepID=A0A8H6VVX7_MYCCL|nr:hypothetical protein HMN09_01129600 [Mycena chlorophos]
MAPSPLRKLVVDIAVAIAIAVSLVITSPIILYTFITGQWRDMLRRPPTYTGPTPLPTNRIDLRIRPCAAQPDSLFLSLPRELRDCIYAEALGGRRVWMKVVPDHPNRRRYIFSYAVPRKEGDIRPDLGLLDPLCMALLRSCRQIYLESHSVLFSHNTFVFDSGTSLEHCIRAALGEWSLPVLRSVCINHPNRAFPTQRVFFDHPELTSSGLLKQMKRLRRLDFQFNVISLRKSLPVAQYDPREVEKSAWGQLVCELSSLEELRMVFTWNREMVDTSAWDPRWNELERGLLAQLVSKRRKNL